MRNRQLVEGLLIGLVVVALVTTAGLAGPSGSTNVSALVSYNPAPLERFHAPLSTPGILGAMVNGPDYLGLVPSNPNAPTAGSNNGDPTGMSSVPVNALRFIQDNSYMPQSETTVGVQTVGGTTYVLSGVNDARFFFCSALPASDCPSGWTLSLSGYSLGTASGTTPTLLASNDLPGILYHSTVNPKFTGFLVSWGDPSIAAAPDGTFYYASLAIDPNTGNNGIMLAKSNAQLLSNPSSCVTPLSTPWSNPCWTPKFVYGSLTGFIQGGAVSHVPATFEDKELIAVDNNPNDATFGNVYISWDHFNADGTSASYLSMCTEQLQCTLLAGGALPPVSGSDPFAGFTTPAVAPDGTLYVTWCNFGTFTTLGPISCSVRRSAPGGTSFGSTALVVSFDGAGSMFPNYLGLEGFATEQFRTTDVPSLAAFGGNVYFVIDVCTSRDYYGFFDPAIPGNCGTSGILYSMSSDRGSTFSTPTLLANGTVNVQPWVTVDPSNGNVSVVYYTTQFDPFNHRTDVVSQYSTDGGKTFTEYRVTNTSDEPNADPAMYDYTVASGFGGSFIVPQYGDYFQAVASNGLLYVVFTGNYAVELGTFQADPFLTIVPSS